MDLPLFLLWAGSRGIDLQPSTEVRASLLGGVGLFAKKSIDEDEVVLRVPKHSVFDLENLFEFAEKLKTGDDSKNVSVVLNAALQTGGHSSESIIIRSFLWGLAMLRENSVFLPEIDAYLQVLLTTPTLDFDELMDSQDIVIQTLVSEKRLVKRDYLKLVSEYPATKNLMSFPQAFQLHQAVKSRVLEIPQAETGLEEYEYSTNITLVPVLDFANHSHANNAVFDVDPASNDIILRVVEKVAASEEITISYDPENSVEKFLKTYGFIPEGPRALSLSIAEEMNTLIDGKEKDTTKLAKWLQVRPVIPVQADMAGNVRLDPTKFRLPLLLIPDLSYYPHWSGEKSDIAEEFGVSTEEEVGEIIAELEQQEKHLSIIVASDTAFGVTWHDNYISMPHILQQTGINSEHEILVLALRTTESVRRMESRPRSPRSGHVTGGLFEQYHKLKEEFFCKLMGMSDEELLCAIKVSIEFLL